VNSRAGFKPMSSIGKGVEEIEMWDDTGMYRGVCSAGRHIELAKKRFTEPMRGPR